MAVNYTKIRDSQLFDNFIKKIEIDTPLGVSGLDSAGKINPNVIPTLPVSSLPIASLTIQGITQLSNNYAGSSQTLAVTELALKSGLDNVRTFYTKTVKLFQSSGDMTVGQTVLNLSVDWPTSDVYGVSVFRNGLYQNAVNDFIANSISKTITLTSSVLAGDKITVVFDSVLNGEDIIVGGFYTITETDNLLALKANITSPSFLGTPLAPTVANVFDSSTQIATTAFVQNAFEYYINKRKILVSATTPVGSFSNGDIWLDTSV